jgi:predicted Holliday junction resolvase-like endonuclease
MYTLGNIKSLVFEKKIFIELCPVEKSFAIIFGKITEKLLGFF